LSSVPTGTGGGGRPPLFLPPTPGVEEPYRLSPRMAVRIAILGIVAIALFCILFFRLWALQVIAGDRYLDDARNNQVRTFRIQAPRGTIVDRNGDVLVSNVAGTTVRLWPATLAEMPQEARRRMVRRLAALLDVPLGEVQSRLRRAKVDPLSPITIKTSVHEPKVNYLLEHQGEFPGVQISETQLRRYELGALAAHVLGYVGEISPDQLDRLERRGYAAGDRLGKTGVEATYDTYLRGAPGVGQVRVDALGRVTSDRQFSQLPEAGRSIRLTIDAGLQQSAERAIRYGVELARETYEKGWASNGGAIVAMDPATGEILALASYPAFDPATYVGRIDPKKLAKLAEPDANFPTLNRALAGLYPPGSTFKPVTALAALQEGVLSPGELIQCTGGRTIDGQKFRNWDPYANEPMEITTALAASCDTYFYDVGLRFYRRTDSPLQTWARRMGFSRPSGIDVGPEGAGLIPTPAWRRRTFETEIDRLWTSGDSVQLAIGQGDVLVTPLQMTRLYALIANGGKLVEPYIVADVEEPGTEGAPPLVLRSFAPKPPEDLGINAGALSYVQAGLYDATHTAYGTSDAIYGTFPVPIAGKTGTAEKYFEIGGYRGLLDQSWFCGYGPFDGSSYNGKPPVVVCALIENGGHGGTAAAPAARLVFEKYFGVKGDPIDVGVIDSD
jgi:penicillin-binding protein 2